MTHELILSKSPEAQELERKKAELSAIETELIQKELELTTLHAELHAFELDYLQIVGSRYTELERIEQQIEEYLAYIESSRDFKPSDSLKNLYRQVAKQIHPDLATDEEEKQRRQDLMAQANQAYEEGNEDKLRYILENWQNSPESVKGDDIGAELIRIIRKIAQCRTRLKVIEEEREALTQTELFQLRDQVLSASILGRDLLAEMAQHLDQQITEAQQRLERLKNQDYSEVKTTEFKTSKVTQETTQQVKIYPMDMQNQDSHYSVEKLESEKFVQEGLDKYIKGDKEEAVKLFTQAIKIDNNYLTAYKYRGYSYYHIGQYQKAINDFTQAILRDQQDADVYKYRGLAHRKLSKRQETISDLKKAAQLYSEQGNTSYSQKILDTLRAYENQSPWSYW